jgi:hypothetical protein
MVALNVLDDGSSGEPALADQDHRPVVEEVEPAAPSGPFEDLVQEMLRRAELENTEAKETENVPDLEWGPPLDTDIEGRRVGTSPETWRERDGRSRVTVAF